MSEKPSILAFEANRQTVKKSAVNSLLIQLLFKMKGIITVPIMTYFMLPSEMGIFNLVIVTASMLTPLFSMNLTDGPAIFLVQERSQQRIRDMYNTVFNASLAFSLVFTVLLYAATVIFKREYLPYLHLVILTILSGVIYKLYSYILAVFQKTTELVRNTLVKDGLATLLSIILVVAGFSYGGLIAAVVVSNLMAGFLVYRLTRRDLPYRAKIDGHILAGFLKMALPLLPVFFFSWVIQSSNSYFLAFYLDEGAVGKYAVVYGLTNIILTLTFALNFFWFPVSARMWVEDRENYRKVFSAIFSGFLTVLLPAVILFELNAKVIMQVFVRKAEYHDAYVIIGTMAFAFAQQVLITLLTAPLYSNKNSNFILLSYVIGGSVSIALNFLLIPLIGIMGAAVSTSISYLLVVVSMSYFNYRVASFHFLDGRLFYLATAFFAAWAVVLRLKDYLGTLTPIILDVPLILALGAMLYFLFINAGERLYLRGLLRDLLPGRARA